MEVCPMHCECFRFAWKGSVSCSYIVSIGLCRTCYVFTELLRPLFAVVLTLLYTLMMVLCAENGDREACVWQASWWATL